MPLNALTLTVTNGVVGRPFAGALGGKSTGTRLRVKEGSAPGFGVTNNVLSALSMPYENASVTINEYLPSTGESRDTTFTLNATRAALVSTVAADGSITYTGGGSGAAPTAQTGTASTSGVVYTVQRLLGSTSTLSLASGSSSNLSINNTTGAISAASAIAVGASQTANVREANNGLAVEYPVTITGVNATPAPSPTPTPGGSIGGVAIGTLATTGPETGMIMVVGDDFDGSLDIMGPAPANRYGKYDTTRANYIIDGTGQTLRASNGLGGVDGDPYWTGHFDSNRGKPIASMADLITVADSKLTLKQRDMVAGEAANVPINNQSVMSSMIHTALHALVRAPAVIEWEEQRFANTKDHMTGWGMQRINGTFDDCETDVEAASHNDGSGDGRQVEFNNNVWVGSSRSGARSSGSNPITVDWSIPHRFKMAYTEAGVVEYYMDDVLRSSFTTESTKVLAEAYHVVFTAHMYNVSRPAGESRYVISWWRYWAKNGSITPKLDPILVQVAANESRTVTLPTQTALWGRSVTEDIQALMPQPGEPGGTTNGVLYTDVPPGFTLDKTGTAPTITVNNPLPGRVTVGRYVKEAGVASLVHRVVFEIGPVINVPDFTVTQGSAFNLDVYPLVNCGTLVTNGGAKAKTITITGLPAGLSYDDSTGLITGTTSAATGERTLTITATNSVGQQATKSVKLNLVAQPVDNTYAYQSIASLIGDFDGSRDASFPAQTGAVSSWANPVSAAGGLTQAPTVTAAATRLASQLGGRSVVRGVRGSDGGASSAMESAQNVPISNFIQGTDSPFTLLYLIRPIGATTGNVGGLSAQLNSNAARVAGLIRRSGSQSSVRLGNTTASGVDLNIGVIPENAWTMAAWRHASGVSDVWINRTQVATGAAHSSTTPWGTDNRFTLFNVLGGTSNASRYAGTAFDGDIAQVIAFNAALTDAQITQMMNDLYTKWSLT